MSRSHERAYRLLAEKIRLSDLGRRTLYAVVGASFASGVWWLTIRYAGERLFSLSDELRRLALENTALKVHGATGFLMLIALGAMSANHIRRGWGLRVHRLSGSLLVATIVLLVLTAYALYYLVDDATRSPISLAHWSLGLLLAPVVIAHVLAGRKRRLSALDAAAAPRRPTD